MTPAHTDSPLRRSEAGGFRDNAQNVTINDDEEERRQARRRTLVTGSSVNSGDSTTFEDNETLKKCLEIYNGNKLSKENAWSLSLIDTLSTLLDRHHKSLNNFKVAGSSLEASSKVYSLRVDSIHTDVLRMSAGLNAQKFNEKQAAADDEDDDDDVATGGEGSNDPSDEAAGTEAGAAHKNAEKQPQKKAKKQRKAVSTVTKNKDTLNARLETVPLQDPVFGKLNSIVGSINSSNRLMNNILLTADSELRLRTTFAIWDSSSLPQCDYTEEVELDTTDDRTLVPCDRLFKMRRPETMKLRPLHSGYIISDTPDDTQEPEDSRRMSIDSDSDGPPGCMDGGGSSEDQAPFHNPNEFGMAFDINAECEPMPTLSQQMPIMDVNFEDLDDLTVEERTAMDKCRGLRKQAVIIEDLRPVDASSKLEYSYRPLDKISQFWAGPSHWKFKKMRTRISTLLEQQHRASHGRSEIAMLNQRAKAQKRALEKKKSKHLKFGEFHDELFIKIDEYKHRKANVQKTWDQRKLKLPIDLRIGGDHFDCYSLAPGIPLYVKGDNGGVVLFGGNDQTQITQQHTQDDDDDNGGMADHHFGDDDGGGAVSNADGHEIMGNDNEMHTSMDNQLNLNTSHLSDAEQMAMPNPNDTVLEIATDYEGAPQKVTKIIVPYAKRAKVIDMKTLKRSCNTLLTKQMKRVVPQEEMPKHPIPKNETYQEGMASFQEIYEHLPDILTQTMSESLSTSIAFYSVLHLANEYDLRLIPQQDLRDFKIRKVA